MTASGDPIEQQATAPPPPPPAEFAHRGQYSVNPLAEVSFPRMRAQVPAVSG